MMDSSNMPLLNVPDRDLSRARMKVNRAAWAAKYYQKFDDALSSEFESDGFVWTNNGGIWKRDLSLQQAKAELRIASIKLQQKQVLEREQANLERMRKDI